MKKFFTKTAAVLSTTTAFASTLAAAAENSIKDVETRSVIINNLRLQNGQVIPIQIAYETYGSLNKSGTNAILVAHGYASSHHAAGTYHPDKAPLGVSASEIGWWDTLIGPGKVFDTNQYFVISSNMLGSSYGSTSPASINPKTGKRYGPEFPEITMVDIVVAQRALLDALGVQRLVTVAGASYGGYLAFQWAVTYPDMMDSIVVAASAPKGVGNESGVEKIRAQLSHDPNWNNGWYGPGGIKTALTSMRIASLRQYGIDKQLAGRFPDQGARDEEIRRLARSWADVFDGHSLIALRRAADYYDAQKDFRNIRAKLLYVLSTTDQLFPPSIGPTVMKKLKDSGVNATYFEQESEMGHLAPYYDAATWVPALQAFLKQVTTGTQQ